MSGTRTAPRTRLQDSTGGKAGNAAGPNPWSWRRAGVLIAFVVCPIGVLLAAPARVVVGRLKLWQRVPGWAVMLAGVVVAAGLLLVGDGHAYTAVYRDVAHVVSEHGSSVIPTAGNHPRTSGTSLGQAVADTATERWSSWVWGQVPLSLCVTAVAAGWLMFRQRRYSATWRAEQVPTLAELDEKARVKVAAKDQAAADKRMAQRANAEAKPGGFDRLEMHLGVSNYGTPVRLTGKQFIGHIVALGPTGAGKTSTMMRIAYGWLITAMLWRLPSIWLDFKGDPELIETAQAFAARTGRACHVVTADGRAGSYTAIASATTADEAADRIVRMLDNTDSSKFENNYYRGAGELWLIGAVTALDNLIEQKQQWAAPDVPKGSTRPWRRDLIDLGELMTLPMMRQTLPKLTGAAAREVGALITEYDPDPGKSTSQAQKDIGGMTKAVRLLSRGGTAAVLTDNGAGLDLEAAIRAGDVVVFSLPAARNARAAQTIGNLALTDLISVFDRLEQSRWAKLTGKRCLILLDEFGALGGTLLDALFERCRSAGGTLLLSAQDEANLEDVSPTFARKVMANCLVKVLHQQDQGAESLANAIGTKAGWKETVQVTEDASLVGSEHLGSGVGSLREVREYQVHPDELKALQQGEIVLWSRRPWYVERVKVTEIDNLSAVPARDEPGATPKIAADKSAEPTSEPITAGRRVNLRKDDETPAAARTTSPAAAPADEDGEADWSEGPERDEPPEWLSA